jgi:hypothetical protein
MLALILVALAIFPVVVVRRHRPRTGERLYLDQIRGFAYVGAAGLGVLAVAVVVVGVVSGHPGRADGLALLGCFGFVAYQAAAMLVVTATAQRAPSPPGSSPSGPPALEEVSP